MPRKLALLLVTAIAMLVAAPGVAYAHAGVYMGILNPAANNVVPLNVPVLLSGFVDRYSGFYYIDNVDLSFDGGLTWERVPSNGLWSASHTFTTPGPVVVEVRAIDRGTTPVGSTSTTVYAGTGPLPPLLCTTCHFWHAPLGNNTHFSGIDPDARPVEVGTRFQVDRPGAIESIWVGQFYTGDGDTKARLWTGDGVLLAEGVKAPDSYDFAFDPPVRIEPGQTYVASFFTPWGHYTVHEHYFTGAVVSAPFTTLPDAGVYRYADEGPEPNDGGGFPTETYRSSYYPVHPVFVPA